MKELLLKFCKTFELSEGLTETLISNVDGYSTSHESGNDSFELFDKKKKDKEEDDRNVRNLVKLKDFVIIKNIIDESLSEKKNEFMILNEK